VTSRSFLHGELSCLHSIGLLNRAAMQNCAAARISVCGSMASEGSSRRSAFDSNAALLIVCLPAFRGSLSCGGDLGDADLR
jgi:hypothetical protein